MSDPCRAFVRAALAALLVLAAACSGRQSDWETARKADTAAAYADFLKRYPDGDFAPQAQARIADLEEEADWNTAIAADSIRGYQQFVERHAAGAHADEARIRIENFNLAQAPADAPHAVVDVPDSLPGKSDAAPSPTGYRVQLGAFSSATRAQAEWQRAVKAHPAELAGLGYTIDRAATDGGTLFRLQTSAVAESRARAICAALLSTREACVVVLP